MRLRSACATAIVVVTLIGGLSVIPAHAAQTTTDKPLVLAPEDKALLYFVRPKRVGNRLSTFLYVDDDFVGVLEDNSFAYALVKEGRHVLWTFQTVELKSRLFKAVSDSMLPRPWEGSEFKVARGGTYYFRFRDPDGMRDTHMTLDESEGARQIDKVKFYSTPGAQDAQNAAIHLANRNPHHVEHFESSYAELPNYPAPEVPIDPTGLVRVDPNTAISLELVQNVTSYTGLAGDEVWFRATGDLASAEGVWLRKGTLVRGLLYSVKSRRSSPRGGLLEVVIPAVVAVDGTVVPTLGEVVEQGGEYPEGGKAALNVLRVMNILGGNNPGSEGGKRAYLVVGSTATIYTRDPAWIDPGGATMEPAERERHAPELRLRVPLGAPARFPPFDWARPNDLDFLLEHPRRPVALRVRAIAGRSPPLEIEAREVKRKGDGWLCTFDYWEIVRFLPLTGGRLIALEFEGSLEDGTSFVVDAAVDLEVFLEE